MLFDQISRQVIISFKKGEGKSNIITNRFEYFKAWRNLSRAICDTYIFKKLNECLYNPAYGYVPILPHQTIEKPKTKRISNPKRSNKR